MPISEEERKKALEYLKSEVPLSDLQKANFISCTCNYLPEDILLTIRPYLSYDFISQKDSADSAPLTVQDMLVLHTANTFHEKLGLVLFPLFGDDDDSEYTLSDRPVLIEQYNQLKSKELLARAQGNHDLADLPDEKREERVQIREEIKYTEDLLPTLLTILQELHNEDQRPNIPQQLFANLHTSLTRVRDNWLDMSIGHETSPGSQETSLIWAHQGNVAQDFIHTLVLLKKKSPKWLTNLLPLTTPKLLKTDY